MPWAKQSIIVAKTHAKDRDEASGIAKGFADRLYTSRETATSFRFRQKPPSKFVWGSYRTKSIPGKGVSIVYGRLKEAGALGTTDNELNEPFTPPGSSFAPSNAQELVRHKPLTPPVSMDTQEGSPTGFRKEAWEGFGDEFAPPGSSFRPTSGRRPTTMDVAPDRVPPVAYEPQNLNSFYTGDERKYAMEKTAFERGFEKKAYLSKSHIGNAVLDALVGAIPFGTTVSTIGGDRPRDHSRGTEWVGRVGGAIVGTAAGLPAGPLASMAGRALGEGIGSYLTTKDLYDKSGKLKASVKKEMRR